MYRFAEGQQSTPSCQIILTFGGDQDVAARSYIKITDEAGIDIQILKYFAGKKYFIAKGIIFFIGSLNM